MQFFVWIETVIAGKSVAAVERNGVNAPSELGLTLEDGKTILNGIEQDIIQTQVDIRSGLCRACIHCQEPQRVKDTRKRRLDTVFGRVMVRCRRFHSLHVPWRKGQKSLAASPLGRARDEALQTGAYLPPRGVG